MKGGKDKRKIKNYADILDYAGRVGYSKLKERAEQQD